MHWCASYFSDCFWVNSSSPWLSCKKILKCNSYWNLVVLNAGYVNSEIELNLLTFWNKLLNWRILQWNESTLAKILFWAPNFLYELGIYQVGRFHVSKTIVTNSRRPSTSWFLYFGNLFVDSWSNRLRLYSPAQYLQVMWQYL